MSKIHSFEFDYEHDYTLIGIHTPLEDYRLAYLLNKTMGIQFRRYKEDLDLIERSEKSSFSIFIFDDKKNMTTWTLISNKSIQTETPTASAGSLFANEQKSVFLIPEKRMVDFLIRIDGIFPDKFIKEIIDSIKKINTIIALYTIDPLDLKSRDHLIFETKPGEIYL
jgi:hypothetical protein